MSTQPFSASPAQLLWQGKSWALTARVVVTAFGENSLAELESYEKTFAMVR